MERTIKGKEGSICGQTFREIQALHKGFYSHGRAGGVCDEFSTKGKCSFSGYKEGIATLFAAPRYVALVHFPLPWSFYWCFALPLGWGRYHLWFKQLFLPFVRNIRSSGYHVLAYLDDFLIDPAPFRTKTGPATFMSACRHIERTMKLLGRSLHLRKVNG